MFVNIFLDERFWKFLYRGWAYRNWYSGFFKVIRICCSIKTDSCLVGFWYIFKHREKSWRSLSSKNHTSWRKWIKCPKKPYFFRSNNPLKNLCHEITSYPFGFINDVEHAYFWGNITRPMIFSYGTYSGVLFPQLSTAGHPRESLEFSRLSPRTK